MTALRGAGVLAIWNGIAPGHEAAFIRWHVTENIPERLSVPGFRRARRYVALDGHPAYFNFYEVADPGVLSTDAYLARLNRPSDWTQAVVPHFTDTSRTLCRVVGLVGQGRRSGHGNAAIVGHPQAGPARAAGDDRRTVPTSAPSTCWSRRRTPPPPRGNRGCATARTRPPR